MDERIKELAEQAGLARLHNDEFAAMGDKDLERFAELVRQDEREACAKLCDEIVIEKHGMTSRHKTSFECAAAIRARGNT